MSYLEPERKQEIFSSGNDFKDLDNFSFIWGISMEYMKRTEPVVIS